MSSSPNSFTNATDFQPWLLALQAKHEDAAKRAETPPNHLRLWGVPKAADLAADGEPQLPAANDTAAESRAKEMAFKLRSERITANLKAHEQDILYKTELLKLSPPEAVAAISDGVTGTLRLTTTDIVANLRLLYGTVSATAFDAMKKALPTSCGTSPAEVISVMAQYQAVFDVAVSIDMPISEAEKFALLTKIMPEAFAFYIKAFKMQNTTVSTRLLANLRPILIAAAEEYSNHYVVNAVSTIEPASYEDYIANAVALASAAGFQPPANRQPNTSNHRVQGAPAGARSYSYCWSHGKVIKHSDPTKVHSSLNCKVRHPNHVVNSTMANMMGGKTTVWERGQPLGP